MCGGCVLCVCVLSCKCVVVSICGGCVLCVCCHASVLLLCQCVVGVFYVCVMPVCCCINVLFSFQDLRKEMVTTTFGGHMDSVRDVQFNPHQFYMFASAYENGNIQVSSLEPTQDAHESHQCTDTSFVTYTSVYLIFVWFLHFTIFTLRQLHLSLFPLFIYKVFVFLPHPAPPTLSLSSFILGMPLPSLYPCRTP